MGGCRFGAEGQPLHRRWERTVGDRQYRHRFGQLLKTIAAMWVAGLAVFMIAVGVVLVRVAEADDDAFLSSIGGAIVSAGLVGVVTDTLLRRAVTRDLMLAVEMCEEIKKAGLVGAPRHVGNFKHKFSRRLAVGQVMRVMVVTDHTWITNHADRIARWVARGGEARFLLPAATNDELLEVLVARLDYEDTEALRHRVVIATDEAHRIAKAINSHRRKLQPVTGPPAGSCSVASLTVAPTYSMYQVGDNVLIRVHEMSKGRVSASPVVVYHAKSQVGKALIANFDEHFEAALQKQPPDPTSVARGAP